MRECVPACIVHVVAKLIICCKHYSFSLVQVCLTEFNN